MNKIFAGVISALTLSMFTAPVACADTDSYLQYLRDHGQTVLSFMEGSWITSGRMVCSELREGLAKEEIYRQFTFGSDPVIGVEAAQHELCPDTLG